MKIQRSFIFSYSILLLISLSGITLVFYILSLEEGKYHNLHELSELIFYLILILIGRIFIRLLRQRNKKLYQAQKALLHSSRLMGYIIEHDRSSVAVHDRDLRYIYVSERYLHDFKINRDVIGKLHYEVFPDLPQKWKEVHQRALAGEVIKADKDIYPREDGSVEWTRWECRPWYDADGRIGGIVVYTEIITDRIKAEMELKESEELYRTIFKTSPDLIIVTDLAGKMIKISEGYKTLFGYTESEIQQHSYEKFIVPEERSKAKENLTNRKKGFNHPIYYRGICKDGSLIDIEVNANAINDEKGDPYHLVYVIRDVSERVKIQKALDESYLKNQALLEANPDIMFMVNKEGNILNFNISENSPYHYFKESKAFGLSDILSPEIWEMTREQLKLVFVTGQMQHFNYPQEINGELKYFRCRLIKSDEDKCLLVISDVTDRVEIEQELIKAKEKAEESDRLKSAFLANMSHEIRTPMTSILGFTELMKDPQLSEAERKDYISIVEQSGERLLNIINDIIEISKIESGTIQLKIGEVNVNEQLQFIYNLFKPEIEKKGMTFSVKNGLPAHQAFLHTDSEKLYAVLINLVKNAIKYSHHGSIEAGYELRENSLQFYVRDTGIGIPPEKQEAIFNRFIQADHGNKRAFEGAGLGLAITKAYVEMLGGKIWLESKPGAGSVFYFLIPAQDLFCKLEKEKAGEGDEICLELNKLNILIVEDDPLSTKLLFKIVQPYSNEILYAKNGMEAVHLCRLYTEIDLILMDIQLPEMDGLEATREIRKFNTGVKIIAQSAFYSSQTRKDALSAGCNFYLPKPLNKNKILHLIQKCVEV